MKEIMAPTEYNVKQNVDHFVDDYMKSAFVDDVILKRGLTHMLETAILQTKRAESRRIEKFIYEHTESVEKNNKIQQGRGL